MIHKETKQNYKNNKRKKMKERKEEKKKNKICLELNCLESNSAPPTTPICYHYVSWRHMT